MSPGEAQQLAAPVPKVELEEVEEENIGSNQDNKQIFLGRDNNNMEQGQNKEDEPNNGSRSNSWDIYNNK